MRSSTRATAATLIASILAIPLLAVAAPASAAALPSVVINEVESNGDTNDWVELVNTGSDPVDVSGWILKDDNDARTLAIPASTVIAAGGFLAVNTDDATNAARFGLGAGDAIRVYLADGSTLVDSYAWTAHASTTFGRCPDGTGAFVATLASTKGAANACAPVAADSVVINEVVSSGGTPGDWVELKNLASASVDVGGLVLTDNDATHRYTIPSGTTIAAGGYLVLDELSSGVGAFDFGLGKADSAVLYDVDGATVIDRVDWTAHGTPSWGRCADGVGEFEQTVTATKGAANDCTPSAAIGAIVVNEVESNGDTTDWVELMNISAAAIDLSGFRFRDNDATRTPFVLPEGTVVEAGGFVVIDQTSGGSVGFDFGLGNADEVHLFEADGVTEVASWSWSTHAPVTYGRCPDGTGDVVSTVVSSKGAANVCGVPVRINEVESSGGTPGDWIELKNLAATSVDVGGLTVTDSDPTHVFTIPAGTTIAGGGYLVLDELRSGVGDVDFGLGASDAVRLLDGTTVVDELSWTAHAAVTLGRCPDGTGDFADTASATKGSENHCQGELLAEAWPGGAGVRTLDAAGDYTGDLSGLDFELLADGSGVLWAVENGNGLLHRLASADGDAWTPVSGWAGGVALAYPDGSGTVDAEGVTVTDAGAGGGVFVASERSGAASGVSRPSVLRYDVASATATAALPATTEWNLATDFPGLGANQGLEGVTWIPDAVLVTAGFVDAATGTAYDPAAYPGHGDGLFFVGVEGTASVYAYALVSDGSFARVSTIATPFALVADVQYDAERGSLWVVCDEACQGRTAEYRVSSSGAFEPVAVYERVSGMANIANEGFAIADQAWCTAGSKPVYVADDADTDAFSLREASIECTDPATEPTDPEPELPGTGGTDPVDAAPATDAELTDATRGGVSAPGQVVPGTVVTVFVGTGYAGQSVRVWLHSTPTLLGTEVVAADGTVRVTLPAGASLGSHRIVVTDLDNVVIGWTAVRVALAATGDAAAPVGALAVGALAALALGAGLLVRRRRLV